MTKKQITTILNDLSYPVNQQIKANRIAVISSDLEGCIYPEDSTRLNFNINYEILEVYYGRGNEEEFIFNGDAPSFVIPFLNIYGITLTSSLHRLEPYRTGQAV